MSASKPVYLKPCILYAYEESSSSNLIMNSMASAGIPLGVVAPPRVIFPAVICTPDSATGTINVFRDL